MRIGCGFQDSNYRNKEEDPELDINWHRKCHQSYITRKKIVQEKISGDHYI